MRTGNPIDGMYMLLLAVPFLISLWGGDVLRRKIVSHLVVHSHCNQTVSSIAGIVTEAFIIIAGVLTGFLLVKIA